MKNNKQKLVSMDDIFPGISDFAKSKEMESNFEIINALSLLSKYRAIGEGYPVQQQIDALQKLSEELRKGNSVRINNKQMGRRVQERPDEILLKENE